MYNLGNFVTESNRIEGIDGRTAKEMEAHATLVGLDQITIDDLEWFVSQVQPNAVLRDKLCVPGVRVGGHVAPRSGPEIRKRLTEILAIEDPYDQHVAYENLHPFTDGNGRSGRVLWLHRMQNHRLVGLGFLHAFYYQTLSHSDDRKGNCNDRS